MFWIYIFISLLKLKLYIKQTIIVFIDVTNRFINSILIFRLLYHILIALTDN